MRLAWPLPWFVVLASLLVGCGGKEDVAGACDGIAAVCSTDADCGAAATCDGCGRCVTTSCAGDRDCADGQRCDAGACVVDACTSNADCDDGDVCEGGVCLVDDCTQRGCPDGLTCRTRDNTCVACLADADCTDPAASLCETDSGACVACRRDADCPGARCGAANHCVACVSNDDCHGETPNCRVDVGLCGTCGTDADCPTGSFCQEDATCYLGPTAGEACEPGGGCAPGHICAGQICRALCDLYRPECPAGTGCGVLGNDEGRALFQDGKPLAACLDASTGVGQERPCGGDVDCKQGLFCVPTSADGGVCKPFCEPGGPATNCVLGDVCMPIELGADGEEVGLCSVDNTWLDTCTIDTDCDAGQGCRPYLEDGVMVGRCQFAGGTAPAVAPCDDNRDCRSGYCLPLAAGSDAGYCWGGCEDDTACGAGNLCVEYTFTAGAATANTLGCRAGCVVDDDCAALGDGAVCTIGIVEDRLVGVCAGRRGPADGGDACTTDNACGTGICFDNGGAATPADAGFCLGTCEVDADCGANTSCREAVLNIGTPDVPVYSSMDLCWGAACARHADCPTDWACNIDNDPSNPGNLLRNSCSPALGAGDAGAACTTGADCRTNFCPDTDGDPSTTADKICWGPCVTSADCATGTACTQVLINDTPLMGCWPI